MARPPDTTYYFKEHGYVYAGWSAKPHGLFDWSSREVRQGRLRYTERADAAARPRRECRSSRKSSRECGYGRAPAPRVLIQPQFFARVRIRPQKRVFALFCGRISTLGIFSGHIRTLDTRMRPNQHSREPSCNVRVNVGAATVGRRLPGPNPSCQPYPLLRPPAGSAAWRCRGRSTRPPACSAAALRAGHLHPARRRPAAG